MSLPFPPGESGLRLKVCGMKFPENILQLAALKPDYIGFIFYEGSSRNFEGNIPEINENIRKTGVFVDAPLEFILEKAEKHQLNAIQLHGTEPPDLCAALKAKGLEVIKVFSVMEEFDFQLLQEYEGKVDFFLFDTKGKSRGGNGTVFNWEILKDYSSKTPFFLSGGIGLEEVEKIKELEGFFKNKEKENLFYGIDVNSRFEIRPGFKNVELVKKLKKESIFL